MCTGNSALVRSVISGRRGRRIEVERHRVDVREHRPRPLVQRRVGRGDKRERAGDDLVPLPHPDRTQRQMQPGGATRTALAMRAPTRAANSRSNSPTRGPSESCPERNTSITARSSDSPRTGRASGSRRRAQRGVRHAGPPASLHPVLQRIDQRVPGGRDHVLRDADRPPDAPARRRRRSTRA